MPILKRLFGILLLFLFLHTLGAQPTKDTVKVGIYLENIYDLNFSDESFKSDYWIWFNFKNDSVGLPKNIEVIKNKNILHELDFKGKYKSINYAQEKIKAELVKRWNIKNFPFDKQVLTIETEINDEDTSRMLVLLDSLKCGIDSSLRINEWKITNVSFRRKINTYKTDFGDPSEGVNTYYCIVAEIEIERNVTSLFLKLFMGVFIAATIALSSLFISSKHTDPRFGLPVGALFASIGNKYVVDSIIPQTTNITLVDKIHFLTFFLILIVIIVSIISQLKYHSHQIKTSFKIDILSFWGLLIIYTTTVILWVVF